jgi:hypothetical protein
MLVRTCDAGLKIYFLILFLDFNWFWKFLSSPRLKLIINLFYWVIRNIVISHSPVAYGGSLSYTHQSQTSENLCFGTLDQSELNLLLCLVGNGVALGAIVVWLMPHFPLCSGNRRNLPVVTL